MAVSTAAELDALRKPQMKIDPPPPAPLPDRGGEGAVPSKENHEAFPKPMF
jgi:hypothetical protein